MVLEEHPPITPSLTVWKVAGSWSRKESVVMAAAVDEVLEVLDELEELEVQEELEVVALKLINLSKAPLNAQACVSMSPLLFEHSCRPFVSVFLASFGI